MCSRGHCLKNHPAVLYVNSINEVFVEIKININISPARIYPQVCWSLWVKQVQQYWSVHGLPCQQSLDNKVPSHKIL